MPKLNVFQAVAGLNTYHDASNLQSQEGVVELSAAVNVEITSRGQVKRRKGFRRLTATAADSLFAMKNGTILCVTPNGLCRMQPDGTMEVLDAGVNMLLDLYYSEFNGVVYYSNGIRSGKLVNGVAQPWSSSTYVGDRINVQTILDAETLKLVNYTSGVSDSRVRTVLVPPPPGTHLAVFNGRIYFARDNCLLHTEGWWVDWYAPAFNWRAFPSTVRMVQPVDDGIFVGTETSIYFLAGPSPSEFVQRLVWDYPVAEGTNKPIDAAQVGNGQGGGRAALVNSRGEILLLSNGGQVTNLTREKIQLINAARGTAAALRGKYVTLLDP